MRAVTCSISFHASLQTCMLLRQLGCMCIKCDAAGGDVVCKAKTGTGKTLSFLIPAVERILAGQAAGKAQQGGVAALIMSPSRELAMQIQAEAEQLLRFHNITAQACPTGSTRH